MSEGAAFGGEGFHPATSLLVPPVSVKLAVLFAHVGDLVETVLLEAACVEGLGWRMIYRVYP